MMSNSGGLQSYQTLDDRALGVCAVALNYVAACN